MTDQPSASAPSPTEQRISKDIDEWYTAAWRRGVRLTGVERMMLARFLAQREDARHARLREQLEAEREALRLTIDEGTPAW